MNTDQTWKDDWRFEAGRAAHAAVSKPCTDMLGNPALPQECFSHCGSVGCFFFGCAIRNRPAYSKSAYVAPDHDAG